MTSKVRKLSCTKGFGSLHPALRTDRCSRSNPLASSPVHSPDIRPTIERATQRVLPSKKRALRGT
ncbi:MAG: hypothetical protein QMD95_01130 [Candidatus Hodarchaeaceae archaeon]|nr:hypothetical protein [Candidatus Hodarchaeaceae archaeon]